MVNILSFKTEKDGKIFFFSDLHYSHSKLNEKRGFKDDEEQKKTLINNWNSNVSNEDTVFLLGDTVLGAGDKSYETFEYLLKTLNYKEIFIMMGNHGAGYNRLFNSHLEMGDRIDKYYRLRFSIERDEGFKRVNLIPNYYEIFVNSQHIVLSHFAILSWNGVGKSTWHLFGHSHNSLSETPWIRDNYLVGKCMDVGFENVKAPISFDKVKEIMDARIVIQPDHHDKNTNVF